MTRLADRLPDFPWDTLRRTPRSRARTRTASSTCRSARRSTRCPAVVQAALAAAARRAGLPDRRAGTPALREADRRLGGAHAGAPTLDPADVLPTDRLQGARRLAADAARARCRRHRRRSPSWPTRPTTSARGWPAAAVVVADSTAALGPERVALVWLNSPSQPDRAGAAASSTCARSSTWARERGAIVVSDECYVELGWDAEPVSVLDPRVNGGSHDGLLAVHSLSKRSNLAGYRAGLRRRRPGARRRAARGCASTSG